MRSPVAHDLPARLAAALRAEGVAVPVDATVTFARALAVAPEQLYWAGRATLVRRPEDIPAYERALSSVLGWQVPAPPDVEVVAVESEAGPWSPAEVLRDKDLGACTDDERAEIDRLIARLRPAAALRPSRRRRPDRRPRPRSRVDLGRTVAAAVRSGGEVGRFATTSATTRPRRLVLLLDVSGSMAPYASALTRFAHAAVSGRRRGHVEVFALGTRLTRVTRELGDHDPDAALRRAAAAVLDWDGGTRLGEGLRTFNDGWGIRGVARGAVVVVLSDGWDRGDPEVLAAEVARLRRVAHRIVWVNPLKASPGFAPLAGGMAAALPHVDDLVEGHSLAALESLAERVGA
jgi:uncharacterized protein with von Willebrand factor type A (vWA) domain